MRRDAPNSPEAVCVLSADMTASSQSRRDNTKILIFAIAFCTVMMIVEGIGGVAAHSLAVLSDAVHMLADVFTLCISLFAAYASTWSSNASYSFGWKRAEVVGAMASVLTTWGLVVWISLSALGRTADILACATDTHREGCEVLDTPLMMGLGVFGFAMNIVLAAILHYGGVHAHSHGSLTPCDHGHSHEAHAATHDDHHNHHQHDHDHNHNHSHSHSHSCSDHNGEEEEHHNGDRCSAVKIDSREGDEAVVSGECIVVEAMNEEGTSSHDHSHGSDGGATSMNVRAALLHVIGDCLQALGVVVAAGVMWVGNKVSEGVTSSAHSYWNLADPLLSLLFGVITIMTTRHLIVEVLEILMEQVPRSVHYEELVDEISSIQHVVAIKDLHVWAVSPAMTVMCCTVSVAKTTSTTESERLTQRIKKQCNQLGIQHCTTQITYV